MGGRAANSCAWPPRWPEAPTVALAPRAANWIPWMMLAEAPTVACAALAHGCAEPLLREKTAADTYACVLKRTYMLCSVLRVMLCVRVCWQTRYSTAPKMEVR